MPLSRKLLVLAGDSAMLAASFFITLFLRFGAGEPAAVKAHAVPFIIVYLLWILILYVFDMYDAHRMKFTIFSLPRVAVILLLSALAGFLLFYFMPSFGIAPKTNLIVNVAMFGLLFCAWRRVLWMFTARTATKRVAFIGKKEEFALLEQELREQPHLGYALCGSFPTLGALLAHAVCDKVDVIVISDALSQEELAQCAALPYELLDIRTAFQNIFQKIPPQLMTEALAMQILEQRDSSVYRFCMRLIEIIFASAVLVATSWISLIIIIAIKINDTGPIIYKNDRVGKKGKMFYLYKFRSMIPDAERTGVAWASANDARITSVGKITRKLHIDEIPQMINILRGDMALVGPRPERPAFVEKLEKEIPYYFLRQTVKPGFTGWAQIKFRYARTVADSEQKFAYDLFYLLNKHFLLDLGIVIKTIQIIFTH